MTGGACEPRFERVREEFERNFAERGEAGASVCVIVDGEPVVDLWGGSAGDRPWERDTMNVIMSCSKGLTAIVAHLLLDRGELELDRPIAHLWPEFAQHGKGAIPVRMALNHSSGVAHVTDRVPVGGLADFDLMVDMVARSRPFWEPGTQTGYHGLTIGWIVGELVRRLTGRTVGTVFREEVAEPLGIADDVFLGLPEEHEHRVAPTIPFALDLPEVPPAVDRLLAPGTPAFGLLARAAAASPRLQRRIAAGMAAHFDVAGLPPNLRAGLARLDPALMGFLGNIGDHLEHCDDRAAHAAEIPAAGVVANARGLAGAYAPLALGGARDGVRLVGEDAIARMRVATAVPEVDAVLKIRTSYTLGFSKSWPNPDVPDSSVFIGEDAFGTPGAGGQMGFADPHHRLAFGYTMTRHGFGTALNDRGQSLIDAVYGTLGCTTRAPGFWVRP